MKATSYLKSKKFLGIPGFFSRLKEKGVIAKDIWGLATGAHAVMGVRRLWLLKHGNGRLTII